MLRVFSNYTINLRATELVKYFFRRYKPLSTNTTPEYSYSNLLLTNPSTLIRVTLVEEAIYDRTIGLELSIFPTIDEATIRRIVSKIV